MTGRRLLATGGSGQLATALAGAQPGLHVIGRPSFDFDAPDRIAETFKAALDAVSPALVINAAAWTAVDAAESEPLSAARANQYGPAMLAELCHKSGLGFIHISTDYVFDGAKGAPYTEADPPNPTGVYGATKLAGELAVMAGHPGAVILRTSWVYGRTGRNFIRTMLGASRRTSKLRVVADQIGCPTNADDLALCVLAVAERMLDAPDSGFAGVTHAAGRGSTSWHGLATAAFDEATRHGWPTPEVEAIATGDWPTPAARPADSRLDCSRLETMFGIRLPSWQPSLARAVVAICSHPDDAVGGPLGKAAPVGA